MIAGTQDEGYVLITAARNEAGVIGNMIESVVAQRVRPRKWVIVSDGSTDDTDAIVERYAFEHDFIVLVRLERQGGHDFAGKVHALQAGYAKLKETPYAYIGNLDADVTFECDYYEKLLERLRGYPNVGIIGGAVCDVLDGRVFRQRSNRISVAGPVQFFRRACYEEIGGHLPLTGGMEDTVAEYMARAKGWETKTLLDLPVIHLRCAGTKERSIWRVRFHYGMQAYAVGYSALYMLAHGVYELGQRPYVTGSLIGIVGYGWAFLKRNERIVPPGVVRYIRQEQHRKLWQRAWRL